MTKPVIELNEVSFAFDTDFILEQVNLNIEPGEMVGIVGPNGGGKTTLLRLLLGLLKPNKGSIKVFGKPPAQISHRIGYVPQHKQFDFQFPVSVLDVVLMGRATSGFGGRYTRQDKMSALESLADVGLINMGKLSFAELSGGQRQRVLIARALSPSAELLFFDEPTANVDSFAEKQLYDLLRKLNKKLTILIVSHDVGFVSKYVNSVVCVNRSVVIHPTSKLDGNAIQALYGREIAMVRHDHRCSEKGHTCRNL